VGAAGWRTGSAGIIAEPSLGKVAPPDAARSVRPLVSPSPAGAGGERAKRITLES